MEAKELMIGDWVKMRLPDNSYIEIAQLDSIDAVLHGRLIAEPIPLTPEILEKNGFVIRKDRYYLNCGFLWNDCQRSCVEIIFYDHAVIDIECNYIRHTNRVHLICDYIHEFQHALRLCGLNNLADNFKVV